MWKTDSKNWIQCRILHISARAGIRSRGGGASCSAWSFTTSLLQSHLSTKQIHIYPVPPSIQWAFLNITAWCLVFHPKSYPQYFLFCCITNKFHVINFYPRETRHSFVILLEDASAGLAHFLLGVHPGTELPFSFLQPICFNDGLFSVHINLQPIPVCQFVFCGTYLYICSCNQLRLLLMISTKTAAPHLQTVQIHVVNAVILAPGYPSPLLRWQAEVRVCNKHWLWCRLPTCFVASCLGLYIPQMGSAKAAWGGFVWWDCSGRRAFLISIICKSHTEDMSVRADGFCWAKENTCSTGGPFQLNRQGLVTQGMSLPDAVAPTCQHRSHVEGEWGRAHCPLPSLLGTRRSLLASHQRVRGLKGTQCPSTGSNTQQVTPGDASPGGQCYLGIQQFATGCWSLRLTEIMDMLSSLLIITFSPFFRNRPSCKD